MTPQVNSWASIPKKWEEAVVCIHNAILLSYKKEHTWVSSNEVNKPRTYYAKWSKEGRERQISCINTYIYMKSRNMVWINLSTGQQWRCRHREQSFGHSRGERRWDDLWEQHWNIYITVCKVASQWKFAVWHREPKASALWQPREWGGEGDGRQVQEAGNICIPMADSCWCIAENITIL